MGKKIWTPTYSSLTSVFALVYNNTKITYKFFFFNKVPQTKKLASKVLPDEKTYNIKNCLALNDNWKIITYMATQNYFDFYIPTLAGDHIWLPRILFLLIIYYFLE